MPILQDLTCRIYSPLISDLLSFPTMRQPMHFVLNSAFVFKRTGSVFCEKIVPGYFLTFQEMLREPCIEILQLPLTFTQINQAGSCIIIDELKFFSFPHAPEKIYCRI